MDKALLPPALALLALLTSSPGAVPAGDVQVFILAGQSNMVGAGKVDIDAKAANGGAGTLRHMVGDPAAGRFAHLVNADKSWVVRDDVWVSSFNDKFNGEYESNMIHFITDVRKELGVPELPFAIAETSMSGPGETHPRALSLMEAQRKAAEHFGKAGRVAFVPTRGFWRPKEQSPSGQGYHWNSNAETYYLIGEGLADALLGL